MLNDKININVTVHKDRISMMSWCKSESPKLDNNYDKIIAVLVLLQN